MDTRRGGVAMIAVGVAMIAIGLIWWLAGGDDDAPAATPSTTTATPSVTTAPAPLVTEPAPASTAAPTTTEPAPATTAAPVTAPSTTEPAPTTVATTAAPATTTVPTETPQDFFDQFGDALAAGDVEFLFERLHPAVVGRYGAEQCRTYLGGLAGADIEITVLEAEPPGPGPYERDELVTTVDEMVVLRVERRDAGGEPTEQETRVAVIDGSTRWFTDCGDPIEGAT